MPTPSKFEAVVPLCGRERHVQSSTFEAGNLNVPVDGKDISEDSGLALVLVDKEQRQAKNIQPDDVQQGRMLSIQKFCLIFKLLL
jgi:hypothetical protein